MIASSFGYGCLSKISSGGASVARARAAKVSIIRFEMGGMRKASLRLGNIMRKVSLRFGNMMRKVSPRLGNMMRKP